MRGMGPLCERLDALLQGRDPGLPWDFIFISMEDETGISNVIVTPDLYERNRYLVTRSKFILAEGALQESGRRHTREGMSINGTFRRHSTDSLARFSLTSVLHISLGLPCSTRAFIYAAQHPSGPSSIPIRVYPGFSQQPKLAGNYMCEHYRPDHVLMYVPLTSNT